MPATPHLRWYANGFTAQRTQYIVTTNAASIYSVVMYGRGITDEASYLKQFLSHLREQLEAGDMRFIFERCIAPHVGTVVFSKTENRSVLGSMNDVVQDCKFRLECGDFSPWELAEKVNDMPCGPLGYAFPREAFARLPPIEG